jgi:hypothetical protein
MDVWLQVCVAHARQQAARGDAHAAAASLLCVGRVRDAIKVYMDSAFFALVLSSFLTCREALMLARLRLPSGDSAIRDVLTAWAQHSEDQGNCEQAAKWFLVSILSDTSYLGLDDGPRAVQSLRRRGTRGAFACAVRVALACGAVADGTF